MKKLVRFLTSRLFITGLLILVQLGWLYLQFIRLTRYSVPISMALTLLSVAMVFVILRRDENPAYKLLWVVFIAVSPLLGGLLYAMWGNKRPGRRMRRALEAARAPIRPLLAQPPQPMDALTAEHPRISATARYVARYGPYPVQQNTEVDYYPIGEALFAAMLEEMERAEKFIFLEYFIYAEGEMWQAMRRVLAQKAAQGVDVRLIYDDMGCLGVLPKHFWAGLEKDGIRCLPFNPFVPVASLVMNNRDHRKMLIVDGHTAFTGGINIADEYINRTSPHGHWKDTGICLRGDAVWNYTLMFLEIWNAFRRTDTAYERFLPPAQPRPQAKGWVQPFSDSPLDTEPLSESVYLDILNQARRYVYIFTPYLIIDNEMQTALCLAAKRGVDVRIVTPGIPDKWIVWQLTRSYYERLMEAGVKIYEYTPGFIHAKSYLSDDRIGVVGTINMDFRSLYLHFECGALLIDTPCLADLKADALATFEKSQLVRPCDLRGGLVGDLLRSALRLFAPLC